MDKLKNVLKNLSFRRKIKNDLNKQNKISVLLKLISLTIIMLNKFYVLYYLIKILVQKK